MLLAYSEKCQGFGEGRTASEPEDFLEDVLDPGRFVALEGLELIGGVGEHVAGDGDAVRQELGNPVAEGFVAGAEAQLPHHPRFIREEHLHRIR